MNWWPFVSRERFEERGAELDRLRAELGEERLYSRKLWNHLQWRTAGGVAFDTTQLPEAYQPKTSVSTGHDEEADKPAMQGARAPKQARRDLAAFEVRQQDELDRRSGVSRPIHLSKEQAEMAARLSKTVDAAQAAGN